jgi:hypothetical protein
MTTSHRVHSAQLVDRVDADWLAMRSTTVAETQLTELTVAWDERGGAE